VLSVCESPANSPRRYWRGDQAPRASSFEVIGGVAAADLDGDGQREFIRSCTSAEGVHLNVWSGAPVSGPRRWHAYHYVGYDMVPSCTPGEIGG
jgi:hypothetical protein